MSVRSMTGYAAVRRSLQGAELAISVRSVNHRGLDAHLHLPPELERFEPALRAVIRRYVARGHLQVHVRLTNWRRQTPVVLNLALLDAYLTAFRRAAAVHGLQGEPDLNAALRLPGMFEMVEEEPPLEMEACLAEALEAALAALNEQREREGEEIASELRKRNAAVRECAGRMEELRRQVLPAWESRLRQRLQELLQGLPLDEQRLAQEAAYLAERSDISEEITRLKIHAQQVEALLEEGGEIGKKLDFLLQEMQRETNTILAKTAGTGEAGLPITELALAAKAEIEKLREQALNLE
ncbi:MAG: YicC/YloC family endoribonuclease [Bryobacterales bacterium]|nr:YicC family protein [Bryobacteraceae bacterium]MDW8130430.1 YicC/YloC family endoribonuclease [Bryobacterales bacterium]